MNALQPSTFKPLPLSCFEPAGWLKRQLRLQANGLSGHLCDFWPDIADSKWFGGKAEGWERAPYWLDGVLPLAHLLRDEKLIARVHGYLDYIIAHQHPDGWLGPGGESRESRSNVDMWGQILMLKVLAAYGEISGEPRALVAVKQGLFRLGDHIGAHPLFDWAKFRSFDALIPTFWLYGKTGDGALLDLATKFVCQGFDWAGYFKHWPETDRARAAGWTYAAHVVNAAQALKAPALIWQLTGSAPQRAMSETILKLLDASHGQPSGMFSGDECLAGPNPVQGTELCAVVEAMYSLEVLTAVLGDGTFADRLERIAFNALPGTFSADMWSHQYVQQANQISCTQREKPLWTTNNHEANIFGLEPNYGCCTANLSQGWPKFAASLWMGTHDGGLAAVSYAPCEISTKLNNAAVRVAVSGEYPFRERVRIDVTTGQAVRFPLLLRIPGWANGATVRVGSETMLKSESGNFHRLEREWNGKTTIELHLPMRPRGERGFQNSLTITRGPLVYALKIKEEWTRVNADKPHRELPHADFEVRPASVWNYAVDASPASLEADVTFREQSIGEIPFAGDTPPVSAFVKARKILEWRNEGGDTTPLPESPVVTREPVESVELVPYGCARLRISALPTLK